MDFTAHLVAKKISEYLGQQVIVENRPGAGSSIGTEKVAASSADGYNLLLIDQNDGPEIGIGCCFS